MTYNDIIRWGKGALAACILFSSTPAIAEDFQTHADWSSRETIDDFTDEYQYMAMTPNANVLELNMRQPFMLYATTPQVTFIMIETQDVSLLVGSEDVTVKFRIDKGEIIERAGYHVSDTQFNVDGDPAPIVELMLKGEKIAVRINSEKSVWTYTFSLLGFTEASARIRAATDSASN